MVSTQRAGTGENAMTDLERVPRNGLAAVLLFSAILGVPRPVTAQVEIADGYAPRASALELAADGSLLIAHGAPGARLLSGSAPAFDAEPLDPHCDDVGSLTRHDTGQLIACYQDRNVATHRVVAAWWNGATWRFDELDRVGGGNGTCVAAFDGNAEPVVAWMTSEGVRVARASGGVWDNALLDPGPGAPVFRDALSLAVDADGHPAISMRNRDGGAVELARWTGSEWAIDRVASGFPPGWTTAVAFDPMGAPAVAYRDSSSEDELLATWDGSTWTSEIVRNLFQGVDFRSLRFRTDGTPVLLMGGQVAVRGPMGWQLSDLPDEIVPSSGDSLELDAAGQPVVLGRTHVALPVGGGWETWPIADEWRTVSPRPSLDLGLDGEPRFAHGLLSARVIASAVRDAGTWTQEDVRPEVTRPTSVSLEHDALGRPAVAATHEFDSVLSFSRLDGGVWNSEIVVTEPAFEADLSFGPDNRPVIAYRGGVGALIVADFDGGSWTLEEIDGVSRNGSWPSIAHDDAGNAFIAYQSQDLLKLARRRGGTWTVEVVDADWPTGESPELAFTPEGRVGISYHSEKLDAPRLAIETAAGWSLETIELGRFDVARRRDLVFDAAGRAFIGQSAWATNYPQVMWREWGEWRVETLDEYGGAWPPDIELAPDGRLVAGYGSGCRGEARITWWEPPAVEFLFLRQSIEALVPGWHDEAFPFTRDNDDELAPFPITMRPVMVADDLPSGPLVLYRAVISGGSLPPSLRVRKIAGQVRINFP